jgi:hypothetical protein
MKLLDMIAGLLGIWAVSVPVFAFYWIVIRGAEWAVHEPVKWIAATELIMACTVALFFVIYTCIKIRALFAKNIS